LAIANIVSATMLSAASIYIGLQLSRQTNEQEAANRRFDVTIRCVTGFLQPQRPTYPMSEAGRRRARRYLEGLMPPECRALPQMRLLVRASFDFPAETGPAAEARPAGNEHAD